MVFYFYGFLVFSFGRGGVFWVFSRKVLCLVFLIYICFDRVYLIFYCFFVLGKKDGEMDRNFDTLDFFKRIEVVKGEWVEVEFRFRFF